MCTQKMRALSYIGAEEITFPSKPDISVYRVASLLKNFLSSSLACINSGFLGALWMPVPKLDRGMAISSGKFQGGGHFHVSMLVGGTVILFLYTARQWPPSCP